MKKQVITALEQEAETAKMMVEQEGGKAFVLIASVRPDMVRATASQEIRVVRGISKDTTRVDALAWIEVLQREIERVGKLINP